MAALETLNNRVVIISGAAQNIGAHMLKKFAEEGAIAIGCDLQGEKVEKVCEEIREKGGTAFSYSVDVTNEDDITKMVDDVIKKYGRIDCLVNNAASGGIGGPIPTTDLTQEQFMLPFKVNVLGTFLMTKHVAKEMVKAKAGRIVDIISVAGFVNSPTMTPYRVSKAALLMLMKQDAVSYGKYGIRVNGVAPGSIVGPESWSGYKTFYHVDTEEEAKKIHEENAKHINLVGRYGVPEDIARAVHYFLAEDDFCNGAVINEDGGAIITGSILHA